MASKNNAERVKIRIRLRGNLQNFVWGQSSASESVRVNKIVLFLIERWEWWDWWRK